MPNRLRTTGEIRVPAPSSPAVRPHAAPQGAAKKTVTGELPADGFQPASATAESSRASALATLKSGTADLEKKKAAVTLLASAARKGDKDALAALWSLAAGGREFTLETKYGISAEDAKALRLVALRDALSVFSDEAKLNELLGDIGSKARSGDHRQAARELLVSLAEGKAAFGPDDPANTSQADERAALRGRAIELLLNVEVSNDGHLEKGKRPGLSALDCQKAALQALGALAASGDAGAVADLQQLLDTTAGTGGLSSKGIAERREAIAGALETALAGLLERGEAGQALRASLLDRLVARASGHEPFDKKDAERDRLLGELLDGLVTAHDPGTLAALRAQLDADPPARLPARAWTARLLREAGSALTFDDIARIEGAQPGGQKLPVATVLELAEKAAPDDARAKKLLRDLALGTSPRLPPAKDPRRLELRDSAVAALLDQGDLEPLLGLLDDDKLGATVATALGARVAKGDAPVLDALRTFLTLEANERPTEDQAAAAELLAAARPLSLSDHQVLLPYLDHAAVAGVFAGSLSGDGSAAVVAELQAAALEHRFTGVREAALELLAGAPDALPDSFFVALGAQKTGTWSALDALTQMTGSPKVGARALEALKQRLDALESSPRTYDAAIERLAASLEDATKPGSKAPELRRAALATLLAERAPAHAAAKHALTGLTAPVKKGDRAAIDAAIRLAVHGDEQTRAAVEKLIGEAPAASMEQFAASLREHSGYGDTRSVLLRAALRRAAAPLSDPDLHQWASAELQHLLFNGDAAVVTDVARSSLRLGMLPSAEALFSRLDDLPAERRVPLLEAVGESESMRQSLLATAFGREKEPGARALVHQTIDTLARFTSQSDLRHFLPQGKVTAHTRDDLLRLVGASLRTSVHSRDVASAFRQDLDALATNRSLTVAGMECVVDYLESGHASAKVAETSRALIKAGYLFPAPCGDSAVTELQELQYGHVCRKLELDASPDQTKEVEARLQAQENGGELVKLRRLFIASAYAQAKDKQGEPRFAEHCDTGKLAEAIKEQMASPLLKGWMKDAEKAARVSFREKYGPELAPRHAEYLKSRAFQYVLSSLPPKEAEALMQRELTTLRATAPGLSTEVANHLSTQQLRRDGFAALVELPRDERREWLTHALEKDPELSKVLSKFPGLVSDLEEMIHTLGNHKDALAFERKVLSYIEEVQLDPQAYELAAALRRSNVRAPLAGLVAGAGLGSMLYGAGDGKLDALSAAKLGQDLVGSATDLIMLADELSVLARAGKLGSLAKVAKVLGPIGGVAGVAFDSVDAFQKGFQGDYWGAAGSGVSALGGTVMLLSPLTGPAAPFVAAAGFTIMLGGWAMDHFLGFEPGEAEARDAFEAAGVLAD